MPLPAGRTAAELPDGPTHDRSQSAALERQSLPGDCRLIQTRSPYRHRMTLRAAAKSSGVVPEVTRESLCLYSMTPCQQVFSTIVEAQCWLKTSRTSRDLQKRALPRSFDGARRAHRPHCSSFPRRRGLYKRLRLAVFAARQGRPNALARRSPLAARRSLGRVMAFPFERWRSLGLVFAGTMAHVVPSPDNLIWWFRDEKSGGTVHTVPPLGIWGSLYGIPAVRR